MRWCHFSFIQPIIIIEPNIFFSVKNLWWLNIGEAEFRRCQKKIDQIFMSTLWVLCMSVAQSCLTLCDPMVCSLPGSSIHRIPQARILEWVAISFSRGSFWPGIESRSPALQADCLPLEPPGKPNGLWILAQF